MNKALDREIFLKQYQLWLDRKITIREGLEAMGTYRITTWYDLRKECRLKGLIK